MRNWFSGSRPDLFEETGEIPKSKKIIHIWYPLKFVLSAVIFGMLVALLIMNIVNMTNPVNVTGREYLEALKNNDMEAALELASGSARHNMQKNKASLISLEGSAMDYKILAKRGNREYGTIDAIIQTKTNNIVDVNWYRLYIAKETKMYVIKVENIMPVLTKRSLIFTETDELMNTFIAYMEALGSKDWDNAASYLAGQARSSFQASQEYLQEADLVTNMTEPEMGLLWKGKKMAVAGFNYEVSDRLVSVIVTFYKTQDGWKVVNVAEA